MKTCELTGAALDWAVAKCEGAVCAVHNSKVVDQWGNPLMYHDDWSMGGPIIEREKIGVFPTHDAWAAGMQSGPTPLIAAMRCYVASKLGDEIDVPTNYL